MTVGVELNRARQEEAQKLQELYEYVTAHGGVVRTGQLLDQFVREAGISRDYLGTLLLEGEIAGRLAVTNYLSTISIANS